jgi:hypothetical protein
MKRALLSAATATALVLSFATLAFAEAPPGRTDSVEKSQQSPVVRPRYANTAERWRGRPSLSRPGALHPAETTGSEKVYEHVPSVNFLLEGQTGGAFSVR